MSRQYHFLIYLLLIPFLLSAQGEPDYYGLAMEAYGKKDYKSYLSNLREIEKAGYDHPYLLHLYAGAYALNNLHEESAKRLTKLGELGLYYPVEKNPDFKSFVNSSHYKSYKKKYEHQNIAINKSTTAFVVPEKDLIPEGITYDPVDSVFYIGSLHKNKILRVDQAGKVEDFKTTGEDGLSAILGMKVDPVKRLLWVCTSTDQPNEGEPRLSGVFKFDLESKRLIKKYVVSKEGEDHFLNDLVIAPNGNVYISDSHDGSIFIIPAISDKIEELPLPKKFGYPNGITISQDGKHLFLASYYDGITRITLEDTTIHTIQPSAKTTLLGLDGIYFVDNSIIAVQNGIEPRRIVKYELSDDYSRVTKSTILEANHSLMEIPTTGVVAGDYFYFIANSHLRNLEKGKIVNPEMLKEVSVLKVGY